MSSPPAVLTEGLGHRYGDREALKDLSFEVPAGSRFALLGPNGSGKSTLFKILSTLLAPSQGTAQVFGEDCASAPGDVRRRLGVVFQSPSLDTVLTVRENLEYQASFYGLRGADKVTAIDRGLALAGLEERGGDRVSTLSGGLQRRVELAKVSLHEPDLILFDEPTTGLDPSARREFWTWVDTFRAERGTTVLFTTHLLDEAERADKVALLDEGVLVACDDPSHLAADLGGEILTLKDEDPSGLLAELTERFGLSGTVLGGQLRMEVEDGAAVVREVFQAYGDRIRSVTLGFPSLEDVFIRRTGHSLAKRSLE